MALGNTAPLTTWGPLILACALGCATGTQGDGVLPGPEQGGSGDMSGPAGTGDPTGSAGTTSEPAAGTFSSGGTDGAAGTSTGGTLATAGTFSTAGTFTAAGTFATSGTGGMAGGGMPNGGTAGAGGASGGKGGGGAGGTAGKAGTGGTAGSGGGGKCASAKFTLAPAAATASGVSEYAPSQAIDGDPTGTRWASEQMMDNEWLQLDLGASAMVNRVVIVWETAYATDYKLQISDGATGPFTDVYEDKAGNGGTDDIAAPTLKAMAGRYVRMQGITRKLTAYGYSIWEITVYGDTDATCK